MKHRFFMLVAGLMAAIAASAATSKAFKVGRFDAVDFGGAATYIYTHDANCTLRAEGEARDIDQYQVRLHDGKLVVRLKEKHSRKMGRVVFRLSAPGLKSIDLSGATAFYAQTVQASADFDLDISGASKLDIKTLTVKGRLDLDASGASMLLLPDAQCRQLDLDLSGASKLQTAVSAEARADVDVSGASKMAATIRTKGSVDMDLSGASKLELDVTAATVSVDNSGASKARIKVDCKQLRAHNSGATRLVLEGTADAVELDQSGVSKYDTSGLNRF